MKNYRIFLKQNNNTILLYETNNKYDLKDKLLILGDTILKTNHILQGEIIGDDRYLSIE